MLTAMVKTKRVCEGKEERKGFFPFFFKSAVDETFGFSY